MLNDLDNIRNEPFEQMSDSNFDSKKSLNDVETPVMVQNEGQEFEMNKFPYLKFIQCCIMNILLCLLYYFDIYSDIKVMIQYITEEKYWYFSFTALFVLLPWLLIIVGSLPFFTRSNKSIRNKSLYICLLTYPLIALFW